MKSLQPLLHNTAPTTERMMKMILKFTPVFKKKVWGGTKLKQRFDYAIDADDIGECWGISALSSGMSHIVNGPLAGLSLADVWKSHPALFGHRKDAHFPLLVKLIDARENLSIQVHPPHSETERGGKAEAWHILEAETDAHLFIGHHAKTPEAFDAHLREGRYLELVRRVDVVEGDSFYIEAGTLHAIGAGIVLLEIQQPGDVTYRFYDYGRLEDGKERPLHVEEARRVVTIPDEPLKPLSDNPHFSLAIETLKDRTVEAARFGDYLFVVDGGGFLDDVPCEKGDFLMASAASRYRLQGEATLARIHLK